MPGLGHRVLTTGVCAFVVFWLLRPPDVAGCVFDLDPPLDLRQLKDLDETVSCEAKFVGPPLIGKGLSSEPEQAVALTQVVKHEELIPVLEADRLLLVPEGERAVSPSTARRRGDDDSGKGGDRCAAANPKGHGRAVTTFTKDGGVTGRGPTPISATLERASAPVQVGHLRSLNRRGRRRTPWSGDGQNYGKDEFKHDDSAVA